MIVIQAIIIGVIDVLLLYGIIRDIRTVNRELKEED